MAGLDSFAAMGPVTWLSIKKRKKNSEQHRKLKSTNCIFHLFFLDTDAMRIYHKRIYLNILYVWLNILRPVFEQQKHLRLKIACQTLLKGSRMIIVRT